ncbi:right-handed parallel beta-helix repeat-containing protein [Microbacterium sp. NPDC096154]|uniref:right-handed parallel beta-helix repeat-containing protein n=1 Tax=Microbacterium sp. NPDC096154 TaxID=3155549 RepID=UPI00331C2FDF
MIPYLRTHPLVLAIAAFLLGALFVSALWGGVALASASGRATGADAAGADGTAGDPDPTTLGQTASPSPSASPSPTRSDDDEEDDSEDDPVAPPEPPRSTTTECPSPTVTVSTAAELQTALDEAAPGDVIELQAGRYVGEFVATESGTEDQPITLCGSSDAILDGDGVKGGYVFHLDQAEYWHLIGFSVTNGQKGVMADGTKGSTIEGLTVFHIGDEAIHLRRHSTDNLVIGNDISDTGLRREKFGEGVYVGSAESNWCNITDCEPDESDRNVVEGNTIHGVRSEAVDIKEGTTGGIVRGNTFEGSAIVGADSWVDIKGNDWLIEDNHGVNSPLDGFQTHEILDGWGTRNTFRGNIAEVNGPGFGYSLTPERDNVVTCDNTASNAAEGDMNVECSG